MTDDNFMKKEQLIKQIKDREIVYDGEFITKNYNNYSMPKSVIISSKKIGRGVTDVIRGEKSVAGYQIEVCGAGLSFDSAKLLGHINHICKMRKDLIITRDIDDLMSFMGENDKSNKSRFIKNLEIISDEIEHSSIKIRMGRSVFSRSYIVGYDLDVERNIITYYVSSDFIELQRTEKFILNSSSDLYSELNSEIDISLMQILETSLFNKAGYNTISFDDIKYAIPIYSKRASNIKTTFKRSLDNLVKLKYLNSYEFSKTNQGEVIKFKVGSKYTNSKVVKSPETHEKYSGVTMLLENKSDFSMMTDEEKLKAYEAQFAKLKEYEAQIAKLGNNPESSVKPVAEQPVMAVEEPEFDDIEEDYDGYIPYVHKDDLTPENNICDDGLPF